jgi:hypothetical protein
MSFEVIIKETKAQRNRRIEEAKKLLLEEMKDLLLKSKQKKNLEIETM